MQQARVAVLFVCLGNICRSPLAEAAFRRAAEDAGLDVEVDSAGTGDWHVGKAPDPRARALALAKGCDIGSYRARQLQPRDFERFDHVFVMDQANLADARQIALPGARTSPALLLDLVSTRAGQPVADPYYGDDSGFEQTWADVTLAAQALVRKLLARG